MAEEKRYVVKNLKLSYECEGKTVFISEGCNCIILRTEGSDSNGGLGSCQNLVDEGKLSDLRPWLPSFKNWDYEGEHTDWADKWWKKVDEQYVDPEFWRKQARKIEDKLHEIMKSDIKTIECLKMRIGDYRHGGWKYPISEEVKER